MAMIKALLLALLLTGCGMFSREPAKPVTMFEVSSGIRSVSIEDNDDMRTLKLMIQDSTGKVSEHKLTFQAGMLSELMDYNRTPFLQTVRNVIIDNFILGFAVYKAVSN